MRSLVVDLTAGLGVTFESTVTAVGPGPTVDGVSYDAVVLAMPDPQAFRLLDPSLVAEREHTADRVWEAVLALHARWDTRSWDVDGVFVNGDQTLGWIADDGSRRGDGAPVLIAHSTGEFAASRLADADKALPDLVASVEQILHTGQPAAARVQRWSFARPGEARDESYHLGPAMVGLCGDGWGSPKVETAWCSGRALGQALVDALG
jgi:predicted NAD/FAD-dependent oxidoreductase